jgi:acyl-CoA thioesterase
MTFNHTLGIRVVRRHRDGVTIECAVRPELLNYGGVVHGGVTASLADVAVGMALSARFKGNSRATTAEMKINFLRPVEKGKILARSRLLRVGRTLCVGRVDLWDARRRLVAAALVTYMRLATPRAGLE